MHDLLRGQVVDQPPGLPNQLWISGQHFAHDLAALSRHNIRAVCSVGSAPFAFPSHIRHLDLDLEDSPDQDIATVCHQAYHFIEETRKQTNVLVHCVMGVSRSATVVVYYLMRRHGWGLTESLGRLRGVRAVVQPNSGFYGQLQGAEEGLRPGKLGARF